MADPYKRYRMQPGFYESDDPFDVYRALPQLLALPGNQEIATAMSMPLPEELLPAPVEERRAEAASPPPTPEATAPAAASEVKAQAAIPNAGIYQEEQALAQQAYEAALSNLETEQQSLYQRFGLRMNNGAVEVDPHNQFGAYQQLRRGQASELDEVESSVRGRGLFGEGLAAQQSMAPRYAQGIQNLGLSNDFLGAFRGIEKGKQDALFTRNRALMEAERRALFDAIGREDFTPADPTPNNSADDLYPDPKPSSTKPQQQALAKAYNPLAYVRGGAPSNVAQATQAQGRATAAPSRYYTYQAEALRAKKPGQTLKFTTGKGYYLA